MDGFSNLWIGGLRKARRTLATKRSAAANLTRELADVTFPGALALLGYASEVRRRESENTKGDAFIARVASRLEENKRLARLGIDLDEVDEILVALFVDRRRPREVLRNDKAAAALMRAAFASQEIEVSPAEVRDVVALLESGEFFGDLVATTTAVFRTLPRVPRALVKDFLRLPDVPGALLVGLFGDLFRLLSGFREMLTDVASDGRLDAPPHVLRATLRTLYGVATIETTLGLIGQLLGPKNRAVRLAVIFYARANGIPLAEKHLDVLLGSVLDSKDPDLGPALAAIAEWMSERYSPSELPRVLGGLRIGSTGR